jgi:hypothetical protein
MNYQKTPLTSKGKSLIGGVVLSAILVFIVIMQINSALAQAGPSQVDSPQVFASTGTLNFQGELTDNGSGNAIPDGSYNMRFAIYDAATGGNKKWPLSNAYESQTGVAVSGGLFNVQLGTIDPITPGVFAGGGDRYLQIWVCTSAGSGCTTYDDLGRLPISSAAYAQNLAAGSSIEGSSNSLLSLYGSDTSGSVLTVNSTATTGNAAAVYGSSASGSGAGLSGYNSANGYGVYGSSTSGYGVYGTSANTAVNGFSTGTSGIVYGVKGRSASPDGAGIAGFNVAIDGDAAGVYGRSDSSYGGKGVYGIGNDSTGLNYGVYGESLSPYGRGVYGYASSTGNGDSIGVLGRSDSVGGTGIFGFSSAETGQNYGVYGKSYSTNGFGVLGSATALTGTTFGVYGVNSSPDGYAVYGRTLDPNGYGIYSEGDAHIDGTLTWRTITRTLTLTAADFNPASSTQSYGNNGDVLQNTETASLIADTFIAPVHLPQNATITKISFHYYANASLIGASTCSTPYDDGTCYEGRIFLFRSLTGRQLMAQVNNSPTSSGSTNYVATSAINYPLIDNDNYGYYIHATLLRGDVIWLYSVQIEYTISGP